MPRKSAAKVAPLSEPRMVAIGSIHPSATNPRKIPNAAVEMVAKSLVAFGWQQPIVVDRQSEITLTGPMVARLR